MRSSCTTAREQPLLTAAREQPLLATTRESSCAASKDPVQPKEINKIIIIQQVSLPKYNLSNQQFTKFTILQKKLASLFKFYLLIHWPHHMWDLISLIGDQNSAPCIRRESLNHWTTREVSSLFLLIIYKLIVICLQWNHFSIVVLEDFCSLH